MHISPRTVRHLRELGHDVVRVDEVMDRTAPDREILGFAEREQRTVFMFLANDMRHYPGEGAARSLTHIKPELGMSR